MSEHAAQRALDVCYVSGYKGRLRQSEGSKMSLVLSRWPLHGDVKWLLDLYDVIMVVGSVL